MAILVSDRVDIRLKKITRNRERHYIMIIGLIHQENISVYGPNDRVTHIN